MLHPSYSTRFRQERSAQGHGLSELKSGLQKGIRRNNLKLALGCVLELWSFGDAPGRDQDKKRIRTNILHRLMIIFLEDVGQEQYWAQIHEFYVRACIGDWPDKQTLIAWTTFMCRLPKSRAGSHARAIAKFADSEWAKKAFPDIYNWAHDSCPKAPTFEELLSTVKQKSWRAVLYAYRYAESKKQLKTPYGRKSYWGPFHALRLSTISDHRSVPGKPSNRDLVRLGAIWGKELQNTREAFLCWMVPLMARIRDLPASPLPIVSQDLPDGLLESVEKGPIIFPSYVMDMHVTGKSDPERFALEGSLVENEDSDRVYSIWKEFYVQSKCQGISINRTGIELGSGSLPSKRGATAMSSSNSFGSPEKVKRVQQEAAELGLSTNFPNIFATFGNDAEPSLNPPKVVCKESDVYDFLVRIQLTTSNNRTDVYFATDKRLAANPKLLVVKGPLRRVTDVDQAHTLASWKKQNGLPSVETKIEWLYPDRWPEGVPLGIRNSVSRNKPAPFLVFECLYPIPCERGVFQIPTRTHSSKLWPATTVVDLGPLGDWRPMKMATTVQEQKDYVLGLFYRYVFGLGDIADRNFVRASGRVTSIDEDGVPALISFQNQLRKNKAAQCKCWCEKYWSELEPQIKAWKLVGPYAARRNTVLHVKAGLFDL